MRDGVFGGFLLLPDGAQDIARMGDVRQIDLCFDFVFRMSGSAGWPCGSRSGLAAGTEEFADEFGFVLLERAGMRFLFGNADLGQHVKNGFALDLQLTGQIIDSNLHPL